MHLVKVPEKRTHEMLTEFINTSAFTFEGLCIDNKDDLNELENILLASGYDVAPKDRVWYWFNGNVMNEEFGLTGDNAYKDELTFVVIPNYYNPIIKLQCGARWFDDIVANNQIKQRELIEEQVLRNYEEAIDD